MADFSFVSTARFRPFSYQEMLQPIQAYTQEFRTIEEGMGELAAKADVYKNIANQQTDPDTYAMYKKYADDLEMQVDSFARNGLTPGSRQGLLNMKRRYASEITPIELGFQAKKESTKWWRDMFAKDGTLISDIDPSLTSLDAFVKNPNLTPKFYSGQKLHDTVFQSAQQLAKTIRQDKRKWESILDRQYYETLEKHGFQPDEVLAAIQGNPKARKEFQQIVEDAIDAAGIRSWANEEQMKRFYDSAYSGLWGAIGGDKYTTLANLNYKNKGKSGSTTTNPSFIDNRVAVGTRVNNDYKDLNLDKLAFTSGDNPDVTTKRITDLEEELAKAERKERETPSAYKQANGYLDVNTGKVIGSESDDLRRQIKEEKEAIFNLNNAYSFFPSNRVYNLNMAKSLEKAQSLEQLYADTVPFVDTGVPNDMSEDVSTAISLVGDDVDVAYEFKQGKKGKGIRKDDVKDFISSAKKDGGKMGLVFAPGVGIVLTNNKSNESIVLGHNEKMQRVMQRAEATNEFLRNFKNIKPIDANEIADISSDDTSKIVKEAKKLGVNLGNGLYGLNIRLRGGVIKNIVVDTSDPGNVAWYDSSSDDEINNGGRARQKSATAQIRTDFLRQFSGLFGNRKPSGTLTDKQSWTSNNFNTYEVGFRNYDDNDDNEDYE